jgi:hypothetical protein
MNCREKNAEICAPWLYRSYKERLWQQWRGRIVARRVADFGCIIINGAMIHLEALNFTSDILGLSCPNMTQKRGAGRLYESE